MQARRFDAAAKAYATALMKKPRTTTLIKLVHALERSERKPTDVVGELERWMAAHPADRTARRVLAAWLTRSGQLDKAVEQHERLLKETPDDIALINNLAWLYNRVGDGRALAYAANAYRLGPGQPAVLDTYGWLLVENGEANRGLDLLRLARLQAPREPRLLYHIGAALAQLGHLDEARRELQAAVVVEKPFDGLDAARKLLARLNR